MFGTTPFQLIKVLMSGAGVILVTMEIHSCLDNRVLRANATAMWTLTKMATATPSPGNA